MPKNGDYKNIRRIIQVRAHIVKEINRDIPDHRRGAAQANWRGLAHGIEPIPIRLAHWFVYEQCQTYARGYYQYEE